MNILLIGGTRNVGHHLAIALSDRGDRVTTFNRGQTADDLGPRVERLHGDRRDRAALEDALQGRSFDGVVDMIAMQGEDTRTAIEILAGRVDHYVHISTGQVYLVRDEHTVPSREADYEGPLMPEPKCQWEAAEWRYGTEKRACEELLVAAWEADRFPSTRLRPPMIHGERDHHGRIQGMVLRLLDGGPLIVPAEAGPPLRHLYQADLVTTILKLLDGGKGRGEVYNLAQLDEWSFEDFLSSVADLVGVTPTLQPRPRRELVEADLFPSCAPLCNPWMSVLDSSRAQRELELEFTPFETYLPPLVEHFLRPGLATPPGFDAQRQREIG